MEKRLSHILKRINSIQLARLWCFYRNYFADDDSCLNFIYETVANEPEAEEAMCRLLEMARGNVANDADDDIYDSRFIPRRMMNAVERLVTTAQDMEKIRRGKDIFKVVLLISCIETLQRLRGETGHKKELMFSFFENYTNEDNKRFIAEHFMHYDEEYAGKTEDSFKQFVGVLNELRNCATHEGEYWDFFFNNNQDGYRTIVVLDVDLENFSPRNKKNHSFRITASYRDFERIFVQTCISYINDYAKDAASK